VQRWRGTPLAKLQVSSKKEAACAKRWQRFHAKVLDATMINLPEHASSDFVAELSDLMSDQAWWDAVEEKRVDMLNDRAKDKAGRDRPVAAGSDRAPAAEEKPEPRMTSSERNQTKVIGEHHSELLVLAACVLRACHDFMSPVQAPSDFQSTPICTHVESMLTSLSTLHGKLCTMQTEEASVLRERAACLLTCARNVHDAMKKHTPGRKAGWLEGQKVAPFQTTCDVFGVLANAAKEVWVACKQDLVAFEGACLRVALARLHRRLNDANWTVNEDMLLMSQAPLVGPRHETISVPGRTYAAAKMRLTRLRQAVPTELTFLWLGRPRAQAAAHAKAHAKRNREVISSLHSHLSKERVTLETLSSLATRMLKAQGASRRNRRLLHEQCRKVVATPYPWLLCNFALPARQLQHDEWTDLSLSSEEEAEYKRVVLREETFFSKRPPLPPNPHVDFITQRATIPHEWPLRLPASRFILESKPGWQADAPPATWHCGSDCSCGDFHHSKASYLASDVTASTTIGTITAHIAAWLRRLPELRRLRHVLNQPGCTVRMLLLDDGSALHGPGRPSMRVLAPTSTAKEVGLFNNRDRIFITVDELSPFNPPLPRR